MAPRIMLETLELDNPANSVNFVSHDALVIAGEAETEEKTNTHLTLVGLTNGVPNILTDHKQWESIKSVIVTGEPDESLSPPYTRSNHADLNTSALGLAILDSPANVGGEKNTAHSRLGCFKISANERAIEESGAISILQPAQLPAKITHISVPASKLANHAAAAMDGNHPELVLVDLLTMKISDRMTLPADFGPITDLSLGLGQVFFISSGRLHASRVSPEGKFEGELREGLLEGFSNKILHVRNLEGTYAFIGNRARNNDPSKLAIWVRSHGKYVPSIYLPREFNYMEVTCFETLHLPAESKPEQWAFAVAAGTHIAMYTYTKIPDNYPRIRLFKMLMNAHETPITSIAFSPVRPHTYAEVEKNNAGAEDDPVDIETISLASVSGGKKLLVHTFPIIKTPHGRFIHPPAKSAFGNIFLSMASMAVIGIFLQYLFGASIIGLLV